MDRSLQYVARYGRRCAPYESSGFSLWEGEDMHGRTSGLVIFAIGVVCMHLLMTLNFWLIVVGIVPEGTLWGIVSAASLWGALAWGLGPPIGAVLMVIGGLICGRRGKEVVG
jgi:hypothetical protein